MYVTQINFMFPFLTNIIPTIDISSPILFLKLTSKAWKSPSTSNAFSSSWIRDLLTADTCDSSSRPSSS